MSLQTNRFYKTRNANGIFVFYLLKNKAEKCEGILYSVGFNEWFDKDIISCPAKLTISSNLLEEIKEFSQRELLELLDEKLKILAKKTN